MAMCLAPSAYAQFTITDGNASYKLSDIPNVPTDETADSDFKPDGTVDHLWEDWWWFRKAGDTRESAFYAPVNQTVTGNTATLSFSYSDFDAAITYLLTDGPGPGQASLVQTVSVTNTSSAQLIITLFHQADVDVNGTDSNDFVQLVGFDRIRYFDSATPAYVTLIGADANNWAVQDKDFDDLEDLLTDAFVLNLANTGLPFGIADASSAFQWNLSIAPGGTTTVTSSINANLVPEPTSVSMLLLGAAMMFRRRRRNVA